MSERNYWTRMRRQRLSRRSLLRASARAGVGAAGLALVGCGDDDDDSAQPSTSSSSSSSSSAAQQQQQDQDQAAEQQAMQQEQQEAADDDQQQQQEQQQAAATTSSDSAPAARVGELNVPDLSGSFSQLDPVTGSGGNDHQHLWVGHDNLVGYDTELVPDTSRSLAESWEVSDDGLKIIFTIRPNVKFHDGE